jgi:hypothetical protein
LLATLGCSGTETGNPGSQVSLAISVRSSDEVKVSQSDAESALHVETALISLDNVQMIPCSGDASAHLGATIVDLTDDSPTDLTLEGTASEACGIKFDVAPPATDGSVLGEYSLLLGGTRSDGTPFEVRSQLEHTVTLSADASFDPGHLILAFDLAVWLDPDEVHGAVLHEEIAQIDEQANPELLMSIEGRFDLGAELFVDADADGQLDSGET